MLIAGSLLRLGGGFSAVRRRTASVGEEAGRRLSRQGREHVLTQRAVAIGDLDGPGDRLRRRRVDRPRLAAQGLAAELEKDAVEGVVATYFVNPRCPYYNLMEPEITALVRRIRAAVDDLLEEQYRCWQHQLVPLLDRSPRALKRFVNVSKSRTVCDIKIQNYFFQKSLQMSTNQNFLKQFSIFP